MVITMYCWRCKADMPMLTEEERQEVDPISYFEQVKRSRRDGCTLAEAQKAVAICSCPRKSESLVSRRPIPMRSFITG